MKEAKLQYSIKVPPGYITVIAKGKEYLNQHRDLLPKKSLASPIFIADVFQYSLDLLADHLNVEFKNEGDIEIVENPQILKRTPEEKYLDRLQSDKIFKKREYKAQLTMTTEMTAEYTRDYRPKGISIIEYLEVRKSLD